MNEITVKELKTKKDNNDSFTLLDVREAHEYYISDLDGTTRIPLEELKNRLNELEKEDEIVVLCRSGNSAGDAVKLLIENDFKNVRNLKGGINEWAKEIDPTLPEY